MAIPAGVNQVLITVGGIFGSLGSQATVTGTVKPVFGGTVKSIVWEANGDTYSDVKEDVLGESGVAASFAVVDPTQDGWVIPTPNGLQTIKNWAYLFEGRATFPNGSTHIISKAFQITAGQTTIDLDTVPDGQVSSGVVAPAVGVSSVNGQTGAVVITPAPATITDADIATIITDRATASNLSVSRAAIHSIEGLGVSRPVSNGMKLVTNFTAGKWVDNGGATVLTQAHTGYDASGAVTGIISRTGQPSMLKWSPPADTVGEINLSLPATNLRTPSLGGKFMLAVYVEAQPGYQPGNVDANLKGLLGVTLTTTTNANGLYLAYNVNQIREGWNFLKFVMRDPQAYVPSSGVSETHPFGLNASTLGTGSGTNIKDAPIVGMKIAVQNMGGATLYFDSVWTGWNSMAQVVLGCDQATADTVSLALPQYQQYGWVGYFAMPLRLWAGGDTILTNIDSTPHWAHAEALYAAGWDCVNHTVNHLPGVTGGPERMASLTDPAAIMYEMRIAEAAYRARGMTRGVRYYASPLSSSSRLSEKVIREGGWLLQRHSRKMNVSVTPWGVDNMHHLGSSDLGSAAAAGTGVTITTGGVVVSQGGLQRFTRIKRALDTIVAYGDTWIPFWHQITQVGDSGTGEDLTGDNVTITWSALSKTFEYIRELEVAGTLRVCDGLTGFYYGVG